MAAFLDEKLKNQKAVYLPGKLRRGNWPCRRPASCPACTARSRPATSPVQDGCQGRLAQLHQHDHRQMLMKAADDSY